MLNTIEDNDDGTDEYIEAKLKRLRGIRQNVQGLQHTNSNKIRETVRLSKLKKGKRHDGTFNRVYIEILTN